MPGAKEWKHGNEGSNGERRSAASRRSSGRSTIAVSKFVGNAIGQWKEFTRFLSDVRAEMRKVVTPSRKEVKSTTTVVIIAVFIFGLFFFVVDSIFQHRPACSCWASWAGFSSNCSARNESEDGRRIGTTRAERRRAARAAGAASCRSATSASSGTSCTPTRALSARCASRSRAVCRPSG